MTRSEEGFAAHIREVLSPKISRSWTPARCRKQKKFARSNTKSLPVPLFGVKCTRNPCQWRKIGINEFTIKVMVIEAPTGSLRGTNAETPYSWLGRRKKMVDDWIEQQTDPEREGGMTLKRIGS